MTDTIQLLLLFYGQRNNFFFAVDHHLQIFFWIFGSTNTGESLSLIVLHKIHLSVYLSVCLLPIQEEIKRECSANKLRFPSPLIVIHSIISAEWMYFLMLMLNGLFITPMLYFVVRNIVVFNQSWGKVSLLYSWMGTFFSLCSFLIIYLLSSSILTSNDDHQST